MGYEAMTVRLNVIMTRAVPQISIQYTVRQNVRMYDVLLEVATGF